MAVSLNSTGITFADGTSIDTNIFPTGTNMLFEQSSAPTGWTKSTTHNDKALRVVSGTASSGGSLAFSTAFSSRGISGSVSGTTLSTSQIPSHQHGFGEGQGYQGAGRDDYNFSQPAVGDANSLGAKNYGSAYISSKGGNGAHYHSFAGTNLNMAVQYVDVIIAVKN